MVMQAIARDPVLTSGVRKPRAPKTVRTLKAMCLDSVSFCYSHRASSGGALMVWSLFLTGKSGTIIEILC